MSPDILGDAPLATRQGHSRENVCNKIKIQKNAPGARGAFNYYKPRGSPPEVCRYTMSLQSLEVCEI
jgi:hypothetical protein